MNRPATIGGVAANLAIGRSDIFWWFQPESARMSW